MTDHPNLASALVAALADLTVVETARTAKIPLKSGGSYEYKYADIGDVIRLSRPVLAAHGIVALTPVHDHGDGLACTVKFVHSGGDVMDLGPFPFPHGRDAQATGSMVTYHRRYALVAALGIAAGDDDDGATAAPRERNAPRDEPAPRSAATDDLTRVAEWLTAHPDRKQEFKSKFGSVVPSKVNDLPDALAWINGAGSEPASSSPEGEAGAEPVATGASSASRTKYADEEPF